MPSHGIASDDLWSPSLMTELRHVRSRFPLTFDRAWRRERMFRYVYWISTRHQPPFNLVGSWRDEDIRHEIVLWREMAGRGIDDDEVVEEITKRMETLFEMTLEAATAAATFPGLASAGYPIWNDAVGCLLPQELGPLRISATTDYETTAPGQGIGYSYRPHETGAGRCRADLYLYTLGEATLGTGIEDPRVLREANRAWSDAITAFAGWTVPPDRQIGPAVEACRDPHDRECAFIGIAALMKKDGADEEAWTTLSLTTLNGAFLKVRYTVHIDEANAARVNDDLARFNSDIASFCCHFAPASNIDHS